MKEDVKSSAIPYVGYRYQTLQGVSVLAQWLASPFRYRKVRFECDDHGVGPQGLDDIVAHRADGKYDYWQVKYTPSGALEEYPLNWDWLLYVDPKAKKSRSFLRKWYDAVAQISPQDLGDARLITNREPDREFSSCLRDGFIDYTLIPDTIKTKVNAALGGAAAAVNFLKVLKIQHSDRSYLSLEGEVKRKLLQLNYDEAGIERLKSHAADWASFKNEPKPDGWITLDILAAVLSTARPSPIPENFLIPDGYIPPDPQFHGSLLSAISARKQTVFTLVGPPGRGKSTYLSYLCQSLEEAGIPVIRHHYFLSSNDRSVDRLSPHVVAESLLSQISRFHAAAGAATSRNQDLNVALETCAAFYKQKGMPFVVVMDGLDHVWRNNHRDKRPLDEVFAQLIPTAENLVIIVGTQPVDDAELPSSLVRHCPRAAWHELPPMSLASVLEYVRTKVCAKRWKIPAGRNPKGFIEECAMGLHALTKGHPLHLIYSVEELLAQQISPTVWDIEHLPACPANDIRQYYQALWRKLDYVQRDILHLICAFPFFWPQRAFGELQMMPAGHQADVRGILHLMHETIVGLRPFHESLIVFVRSEPEHETRVNILSEHVENWLLKYAPVFTRDCWLLSVKARRGDRASICKSLTRDWILDKLADGYPIEVFIRMLSEAESYAFESRNYPEAYRLRSLKTRLLNGPDFQISDAAALRGCSLNLASDASVIDETYVSRADMTTIELAHFGIALKKRGDTQRAIAVARAAYQQHEQERKFRISRNVGESRLESEIVLRSFVTTGAIDINKFTARSAAERLRFNMAREVATSFVDEVNIDALVQIQQTLRPSPRAAMFEEAAIRAMVVEGAEITAWEEFQGFGSSSLATAIGRAAGKPLVSPAVLPLPQDWAEALDWDVRNAKFRQLVQEWFLKSVVVRLDAVGEYSMLPPPSCRERPNLHGYFEKLDAFAAFVSREIAARRLVGYGRIFRFFDDTRPPQTQSHNQWQAYRDFFKALHRVSVDCRILSAEINGTGRIATEELREALETKHFNLEALLSYCVTERTRILSDEAALFAIDLRKNELLSQLRETRETAEGLFELCELSMMYGLTDLARQLCRLCWDFVLGYDSHKDITIFASLDALEYLVEAAPDTAHQLLLDIAPQIHAITKYTNGDETRHAHAQASNLLARLDQTLLVKQYREYIQEGDWHRAEEALRAHFKHASLKSPLMTSWAKTGISTSELGSLAKRAQGGDVNAIALFRSAIDHIGGAMGEPAPVPKQAHETLEGFKTSPADYPPEQFDKLLSDLEAAKSFDGHRYLPEWFDYWVQQKKESRLFRAVAPYISAADIPMHRSDVHHLLDQMFDTALKLKGPKAAFDFIVKAHMANGGWSEYMFEQREKSETRLRKVAVHYGDKADEFVTLSARTWLTGKRNPSTLVIPGTKLVFFLKELGRTEEAVALTRAIVASLQEDTRRLPLRTPEWAT